MLETKDPIRLHLLANMDYVNEKLGLREVVWVILPDFTAQGACK